MDVFRSDTRTSFQMSIPFHKATHHETATVTIKTAGKAHKPDQQTIQTHTNHCPLCFGYQKKSSARVLSKEPECIPQWHFSRNPPFQSMLFHAYHQYLQSIDAPIS